MRPYEPFGNSGGSDEFVSMRSDRDSFEMERDDGEQREKRTWREFLSRAMCPHMWTSIPNETRIVLVTKISKYILLVVMVSMAITAFVRVRHEELIQSPLLLGGKVSDGHLSVCVAAHDSSETVRCECKFVFDATHGEVFREVQCIDPILVESITVYGPVNHTNVYGGTSVALVVANGNREASMTTGTTRDLNPQTVLDVVRNQHLYYVEMQTSNHQISALRGWTNQACLPPHTYLK